MQDGLNKILAIQGKSNLTVALGKEIVRQGLETSNLAIGLGKDIFKGRKSTICN